MSNHKNIEDINWKKKEVDVVVECTGKFNNFDDSSKHIINGAKKVILSAPGKNVNSFIYGINHHKIHDNNK